MKKLIGDIKHFSFSEMTSNDNGKTSASSTAGIYVIAIGGLCFLLGCLHKMFLDGTGSIDIITQSIVFTGIGVTLLGVNKIAGSNVETAQIKASVVVADPVADLDPVSEEIPK